MKRKIKKAIKIIFWLVVAYYYYIFLACLMGLVDYPMKGY